jgi:DNA polymerase III alpha subunit
MADTGYAELATASNFSFLRGASHPEELAVTAKRLGLSGLGLADRNTVAGTVRAQSHELALVEQLQYAPYFLTVYDIVRFARSQGILCQGRGSAANSAVCFCIGITEVDPGAGRSPVRAVHLAGTARAAGYRRRFRA